MSSVGIIGARRLIRVKKKGSVPNVVPTPTITTDSKANDFTFSAANKEILEVQAVQGTARQSLLKVELGAETDSDDDMDIKTKEKCNLQYKTHFYGMDERRSNKDIAGLERLNFLAHQPFASVFKSYHMFSDLTVGDVINFGNCSTKRQ